MDCKHINCTATEPGIHWNYSVA